MKYSRSLPFIILGWLMISGCQDQSIQVPDTSDDLLLVSHAKESSLSFVNPHTDEDLDSTSIPFSITDMVFISDHIMVGLNPNEEQLINIDLDQQKAYPFMELGSGMSRLAFDDESGKLFVADTKDQQIRVIDVEAQEELSSIKIGAAPSELTISEDGALYVVLSESDEMLVIDIETSEIDQTFSINDIPAGMYLHKELVWTGGHGSSTELNRMVYAYDAISGEKAKEIEVGLMPIAIMSGEKDGILFVLCHGDHTLYKINTETGEVENRVEVGQNPNDLYATEDKLFVTNLDSDTISILGQSDLNLIKTIPVAPGPYVLLPEVS